MSTSRTTPMRSGVSFAAFNRNLVSFGDTRWLERARVPIHVTIKPRSGARADLLGAGHAAPPAAFTSACSRSSSVLGSDGPSRLLDAGRTARPCGVTHEMVPWAMGKSSNSTRAFMVSAGQRCCRGPRSRRCTSWDTVFRWRTGGSLGRSTQLDGIQSIGVDRARGKKHRGHYSLPIRSIRDAAGLLDST